jgi:hypothetical protein
VRQEDGLRPAEEVYEVGYDLFKGGLSADHRIGDTVYSLDSLRNGDFGIDQCLEGGQFSTVEAKAYGSYFDQPVHDREKASGFSVEGEKGDIGETWLGVIHEPS